MAVLIEWFWLICFTTVRRFSLFSSTACSVTKNENLIQRDATSKNCRNVILKKRQSFTIAKISSRNCKWKKKKSHRHGLYWSIRKPDEPRESKMLNFWPVKFPLRWPKAVPKCLTAYNHISGDQMSQYLGTYKEPGKSWNLLFWFPGLESHGI